MKTWIPMACLVLALLVTAADRCGAEIVRLPDGRFLQGEILESDKAGFTFKRWDTGGVVNLSWEQILPDDRLRLRRALGLEFSNQEQRVTVKGVRFHLKTGDILEGVVTERTADTVRILRATGEFTYPASVIKREEEIEMDILSIYSEEEAYALKVVEPPGTPNDHYEVATWCRSIGFFEKEKEHLLAVQEGAPDFKPDFIRNRLVALDTLVIQAQVMRRIKAVLRLVAQKKFTEAEAAWAEVQSDHGDSDIVADDSEGVAEQIEQAKLRFTRSVVVKDWFLNMRRILRKKSLEKDLKLADAKKWLNKDLTQEIVATIEGKRGLPPEDIKTAFEERKVYNVSNGSYGTGSFIVEKGARYGSSGGNVLDELGRKMGLDQATRDKVKDMFGGSKEDKSASKKKELTPDDWWLNSTADMKYQWMTAFYAENSGDMEVVRVEMKPCPNCHGKGFVSFLAAGGGATGQDTGTQHTMCTRCQGLGKDRVVVFK